MKGMGRKIATMLLVAVAAASACNGETTETVGSETNWLDPCGSDADCDVGYCVCGVCTEECASEGSCGEVTNVCVAQGSNAYGRLCIGQQHAAPGGLCIPACDDGRPCAAGSRCDGGVCLPDALSQVEPSEFVGKVCVSEFEADPEFSHFSVNTTTLEDPSDKCSGGYCIVHRFQGRVTCPYGMPCLTQDDEPVYREVLPQLIERRPEDASICSCPCAGPEGSGPFCQCSDEFVCTEIFTALGVTPRYPSHFCMPRDTVVPSSWQPDTTAVCDRALANCEDRL